MLILDSGQPAALTRYRLTRFERANRSSGHARLPAAGDPGDHRAPYYDPDDDAHTAMPASMERHLRGMLDLLVKVAIELGSPALVEHLRASVSKHG